MSIIRNFSLAGLLALSLCSLTGFSLAAPAANPARPPIVSTPEEVIVLRTQVAELQRFQEQVLGTVYWTLSALASVTVLLVSFGWWTNFRVYERDKDTLERALRTQMTDLLATSSDELRKSTLEQISEIMHQLDASVSTTENRLSDALTANLNALEKKLSSQVMQVKSTLVSQTRRIRDLELLAQLQEREEARNRNSYRNALQCSVSALQIANEISSDYSVGNTLDMVAEDIRTILAGNDLPIDNYLIGQLIEALNAVTGTHAHAAAALREKASALATA